MIETDRLKRYVYNGLSFSIGRHGINWIFLYENGTWKIRCDRARLIMYATELVIYELAIIMKNGEANIGNILIDEYSKLERFYE